MITVTVLSRHAKLFVLIKDNFSLLSSFFVPNKFIFFQLIKIYLIAIFLLLKKRKLL